MSKTTILTTLLHITTKIIHFHANGTKVEPTNLLYNGKNHTFATTKKKKNTKNNKFFIIIWIVEEKQS